MTDRVFQWGDTLTRENAANVLLYCVLRQV